MAGVTVAVRRASEGTPCLGATSQRATGDKLLRSKLSCLVGASSSHIACPGAHTLVPRTLRSPPRQLVPQPLSAGLASGLTKDALAQFASRSEQLVQQSPSGHSAACHRQPRALLPKMSTTLSSLSFALDSSMELQSSPLAKLTYAL